MNSSTKPEDGEIGVAADVVEDALVARVKKIERRGAGEIFGHEGAGEIHLAVAADDVFDAPG
jgi:hypothetical protein